MKPWREDDDRIWGSSPIALLTLFDLEIVGVKPILYASLVLDRLLYVFLMVPGSCNSCQPPSVIDRESEDLITELTTHSLRLTYRFCTITQSSSGVFKVELSTQSRLSLTSCTIRSPYVSQLIPSITSYLAHLCALLTALQSAGT